MADVTGIAVSGMVAQSRRLDASASNVANSRTRGAIPEKGAAAEAAGTVYSPVTVAQSALAGGGVKSTFVPVKPSWTGEYAPDDPAADAEGMVAAPNVDPATETVSQITASRSYAAGASVVRTADEMMRAVLDMKA